MSDTTERFANEVKVKIDDLPRLQDAQNPEYWVRHPIQMEPNENWMMQECFVGMEGPYAICIFNVNSIGHAKTWRDAKPGRRLFWKLVLEQLTEVLETDSAPSGMEKAFGKEGKKNA